MKTRLAEVLDEIGDDSDLLDQMEYYQDWLLLYDQKISFVGQ